MGSARCGVTFHSFLVTLCVYPTLIEPQLSVRTNVPIDRVVGGWSCHVSWLPGNFAVVGESGHKTDSRTLYLCLGLYKAVAINVMCQSASVDPPRSCPSYRIGRPCQTQYGLHNFGVWDRRNSVRGATRESCDGNGVGGWMCVAFP
jgi:hypothetical protein